MTAKSLKDRQYRYKCQGGNLPPKGREYAKWRATLDETFKCPGAITVNEDEEITSPPLQVINQAELDNLTKKIKNRSTKWTKKSCHQQTANKTQKGEQT